MTVLEMLEALVKTRGITGTQQETAVANQVMEIIRDDPYFMKHPELCGQWDGGDALGRPVVWALKKGSGKRTVIVSGHYDTVGTACYGVYEDHALNPKQLLQAYLNNPPNDPALMEDIRSGKWMVGRGCADMKAGLALNLDALLSYTPGEVNVLFTAVSDEENLSAGARQAVALYRQLQERFDLQYEVAIVSESIERDVAAEEPHPLINGSAGKILPVVVAKGIPAHGAAMLRGINSAHLIAEVVCQTEYDTAFVSRGGDLYTQPPAVQLIRDLKPGYDVSMPEYTAAAFNMTFFCDTDPLLLMNRLMHNCRTATQQVLKRYQDCAEAMVTGGTLADGIYRPFDLPVMTLEELEAKACQQSGYEAFHKAAAARSLQRAADGDTLVMISIHYIAELMAFAGRGPMVVAGIAPPYYPAVNNEYLACHSAPIMQHVAQALQQQGVQTAMRAYTPAMMDLSYLSCFNPESAHKVMSNVPIPKFLYAMDIEAMAQLGIPSLVVGPAGKDIHQLGERVFIPDLEGDLPKIFRQIIASTQQFDQ